MNAVETIIPIIVMIIIGYTLKRTDILKAEHSIALNKIVINIAIPSLIFLAIYDIDLSILPVVAPIPFICMLTGVLSGLIAYIFATIKKYPKKTRWSILLTSAMSNSGFLGYPVVLGVFGVEGLVRAVFYDLGSMILFIAFGVLLLLIYGGKYTTIFRKALIFPPLWAVALAVTLNFINFDIGFLVSNILDYLSGAAIPLIMISLGLSLEFKGIKENVRAVFSVSLIKLFISPAIALSIVTILGIGGLERQVTIIGAAMPSAMLSLVLAITYDLDIETTAACIFASTLISMVTIPLILLLL